MNKPDLALNNLQWLICHKTKPSLQYHVIGQSVVYYYYHYYLRTVPCCCRIMTLMSCNKT